jgi:molecular chaperone IbpA
MAINSQIIPGVTLKESSLFFFPAGLETDFCFTNSLSARKSWLKGAREFPGAERPCCSTEDVVMRYDFTPLYRSTVGFDQLFDAFDRLSQNDRSPSGWPPYDIERIDEDSYRISLAVAGFAADEVELIQKENELVVTGHKKAAEGGSHYLHRGLPNIFKETFNLAQHVRVREANLRDGVLTIALNREIPEALKPRKIDISSSGSSQTPVQDNKGPPEQIGRRTQAA